MKELSRQKALPLQRPRVRNGPDLLEGKKEGVAVWGRENKVDMIWDETRKVDRGQIMEGLLC